MDNQDLYGLDEWFVAGLEEFGFTESEYKSKTHKEQQEIKRELVRFGHY